MDLQTSEKDPEEQTCDEELVIKYDTIIQNNASEFPLAARLEVLLAEKKDFLLPLSLRALKEKASISRLKEMMVFYSIKLGNFLTNCKQLVLN